MSEAGGRVRVGVGGWTYGPWRGSFYPADLPQRDELHFASRQLTTIEINGTFYGSQKPATYQKWHDETPADFVFSLKAPRFATNRKALGDDGGSIERFLTSGILNLKSKLGPINWQLPSSKRFDPQEFGAFLALLPRKTQGYPLRHVVELRHASFSTAETVALARAHDVALVIAGDCEYPQIADMTADFVYARIMGTREELETGYTGPALDRWAQRARGWASGDLPEDLHYCARECAAARPRDVYLYVIGGGKLRNPAAAMALIGRIGTG